MGVEEDLDEDAEAAVLEMEEDNGHVSPAPLEERRRLRVRGRARGSIRKKQQKTGDKDEVEAPRQTVTRDRFRSFPARQNSGRSQSAPARSNSRPPPGSRSRVVTARTQARTQETVTTEAAVT